MNLREHQCRSKPTIARPFLPPLFLDCSRRTNTVNTTAFNCKCTDSNKKAAFAGKCESDPDRSLFFFFISFLPFHLRLSKLLQRCASFPLLCTDNELLHSSADSSSPKATLIVLKHTAPVKLIIVLDCCHFVAGPVTQRVRGFSAQPASCPVSPPHTTFQIIPCVYSFFFLRKIFSWVFFQLKAHWKLLQLDLQKNRYGVLFRLLLQYKLNSNLFWQSGFGLSAGTWTPRTQLCSPAPKKEGALIRKVHV